jgi:NAD(P)-dependent dehydrogenase (short-subunit alcohol dehydrogenase family)
VTAPQAPASPWAPVALVTGGAGGIGRAMCRALAGRGHRVVVADLDEPAARAVAAEVGGVAAGLDVRSPAQSQAAVDLALDAYGRLDVVVLNAGISSGQAGADPLDLDAYRRIVSINVDGVVFGVDAAVPVLRRSGGGTIVATASLAGLVPMATDPLYALTKSAVVGYVRSLAEPLAEHGVRINALCPGFTDTAILGIARSALDAADFPLLRPEEVAAALLAVLDAGGTGEAWFVQAGREPSAYRFRGVPGPLGAGGEPVAPPPLSAWGTASGAAPGQADAPAAGPSGSGVSG